MKRFYKDASVAEEGGAWRVLLDGRTLKTSTAKSVVAVPTLALAQAVAQEWRDVGETIDPTVMHLTRLVFGAIEGDRAKVAEHALSFGRTDLLCYRADAPAALAARQAAVWDPLLAWVAERHGAKLDVTLGIGHIEQPAQAVAALKRAVDGQSDFALSALHVATMIAGSLVLALALVEGRLNADDTFAAATIDETFQAEKWGVDSEAEQRLKRHAAELSAAERFVALLA
jgi:chaperone required for assembly of F1-ATPase